MKAHFVMLAAYNAWVNDRLYDAVARLPDAEYRADHGAFFGSLHGTLNHLLVTDRIWLCRLTGVGTEPGRLDAILYERLDELRSARRAEDAQIVAYVDALTEADLAGTICYRSTRAPVEIEQHLAPLLLHVFNHQIHHRGQAHALLTKLTGQAPSFDLLIFQRQTGTSLVRGEGGDALTRPEQRN